MTRTPDRRPTGKSPRRLKSRWLLWIIVGVALVFLGGTSAVAYDVVWKLIHPKRTAITKTPAKYGLTYRPVTFLSTVDHVRLSGWFIPAEKSTGRIVIEAHGYRKNREADAPSLPVASALHKAGFAVLMFDFRDEGQSQGSEVTVGLYEQRDLLGAVDYARRLGYHHIGLIGYSMGAVTALEVTAKDPAVQAVVADSPFANLQKYLTVHMPEWTHLPNWPFTPEILLELRWFNGLNAALVNPVKDVSILRHRPVLLIAGTADHVIPMSNSKQIFHALRQDPAASLWIVPGAGHVGAYKVQPQKYLHRVENFFQQRLR